MAKRGRIEGSITIPTGGIVIDFNDGSAQTATIAAGDYFLTTLLTEIQTKMDAASTDMITASASLGESGTQKSTLASDGATFTVTWDSESDVIRDTLGFTGNLTGATSYTSTDGCQGVWLPDIPKNTQYGDNDAGHYESSARATEAPDGTAHVLTGPKKQVNAISWGAVSHARTRLAAEALNNESYEQFWLDFIQGDHELSDNPGRIRFYWDADVDGTSTDYVVTGQAPTTNATPQMRENWTGRWVVTLDRLVKV